MHEVATTPPADRPRFGWRVVLIGAVLLPALYLPTLRTPFDFIDDGNLVYPAPPMPLADRLHRVWERIEANSIHLGPFRPVLWVHWETFAALCRGDAFRWRCVRLLWCGLAAAALLTLLRELRLKPGAALAAAAVAMWNPYRNEIWTSLTLAEGVAMPYALLGLYCAARAARSERPLGWDLGAALGTLAALGCKNTFAALVPVQMFLRVACAEGMDWRVALRRHGRRAALIGLLLILPAAHYVYFKQHWHPGQYEPGSPSLAQLGRMVRSLLGAVSLDFMGAGLGLAVAVVLIARRRDDLRPLAGCDRRTAAVGLLLIVLGVGAYLPMTMVSGRYVMPAVWGVDLILAVLFGRLAELPAGPGKRIAVVGLAVGLIAVAVANLGKQEKFAARARLLWQTLEWVEREADPAARLAWVSGPDLNVEEGIHFRWHLLYRGHADLAVGLFDENGQALERCELPPPDGPAVLTVTGKPYPPDGPWFLKRSFRAVYWGGRREYDCYLWSAAREAVASRGR